MIDTQQDLRFHFHDHHHVAVLVLVLVLVQELVQARQLPMP